MSYLNHKDFTVEELVNIINTELQKSDNFTKIISEVFGKGESTIRNKLTRSGYKRVNNKYILVKRDDSKTEVIQEIKLEYDDSNTEVRQEMKEKCDNSNTEVIQEIKLEYDDSKTEVIPSELKVNLIELAKDYKRIMRVVEEVESLNDISSYLKNDRGIVIDLPLEWDKEFRTSIRVNDVIWRQFSDFCEENKRITKRELVSMALLEYMQKYKK